MRRGRAIRCATLAALLAFGLPALAAADEEAGDTALSTVLGKVLDLGPKVLDLEPKALDLAPKVLDIVGVERGVEGALADLGAKVSEHEIRIALSGDVLFDFDKAELRPDALPMLKNVAEVLKSYPKAPVLIEGHTDNKGDDAYNLKLSQRRADSVLAWLAKNAGIGKKRVKTKGWGEAKPVAPNEQPDGSDDPEGRQQNRRVEIVVKT